MNQQQYHHHQEQYFSSSPPLAVSCPSPAVSADAASLQEFSKRTPVAPATAAASTPQRETSGERAVDEYRIGPVAVSVVGPLSLKFPGAEYAEVSVPSLEADVLVIASLADSLADGGCSLGIPRRFVKDATVDRETGTVRFVVAGVRSFTDSVVTIRARSGAAASVLSVAEGTMESGFGAGMSPLSPVRSPVRGSANNGSGGGAMTSPGSVGPRRPPDVTGQLLWLVTGHSNHASPAHDLVAKAATALHAVATLKREHHVMHQTVQRNVERNERRADRRNNLQARWAAAEESERQTLQTRAMFSPTSSVSSNQQLESATTSTKVDDRGRSSKKPTTIDDIVANKGSTPLGKSADARVAYSEQLQSMLLNSILARSPPRDKY